MFYLLSLVLYAKARIVPGWRQKLYFGGTLLSYLLGVFSKENVAILPSFISSYDSISSKNLTLSKR